MQNQRFKELIEKYLDESAGAEEKRELFAMLDNSSYAGLLDEIVIDQLMSGAFKLDLPEAVRNVIDTAIYQRTTGISSVFPDQEIREQVINDRPLKAPVYNMNFRKTAWLKYASILIILLGIGAYLWTTNRKIDQPVANNDNQIQRDILPGRDKAVLTLLDGSKIVLDDESNGKLAQQGNVSIVKLGNGRITYNMMGSPEGAAVMNTISTPKGGQYQLTLPDGSNVWLNAASSVRFPVAFTGPLRKVSISGEVYFEIAKNKQKPFIVDVDGKSTVEVLGTSFNVNSYEDHSAIKATLIAGSIRVSGKDLPTGATSSDLKAEFSAILKPGQQARINTGTITASPDRRLEITDADIEQTLAWKNGIFNFNGMDVRTVMAQLSRWYDIDIRYEGPIPSNVFRGEMYRDVKLSAVLQWLREMGVNVKLDGKTLIVGQ